MGFGSTPGPPAPPLPPPPPIDEDELQRLAAQRRDLERKRRGRRSLRIEVPDAQQGGVTGLRIPR